MRPRIPLATALLAALLAPACAASPTPSPDPTPTVVTGGVSPRLHHLLDLEDSRASLRELEPFLRDPDPEVRARAALAAGRKGGGDASAALRLAARDPEARVREAAAFAMGIAGDPDLAGDALGMTRRAGATTEEVSRAAAAAVHAGGERVWREETFGALFSHANPEARRAAYRALPGAVRGWKEKPPAPPAWILNAIEHTERDEAVRAFAAIALRYLPYDPKNTEVVATVTSWLLAGPTPEIRAAHAMAANPLALDGEGDAHDIQMSVALDDEKDHWVRVFIARALGRTKTAKGTELLVGLASGAAEFGVRAVACDALGARKVAAREAVPTLVKAAAEDPSRLVRVAAVTALHAVGGDQARMTVEAATRSEDPFIRAASAGSLLTIPELAALAGDPEVRVREAAVDEAGKRKEDGKFILLEAVQEPDPVVAGIAATAIGEHGLSDAVGDLEEGLKTHAAPTAAPDLGADFRASALEALGKLKAPSAKSLAEAHLGDPDPSVRAAAAKVLKVIDGKEPELPMVARLRPFPDRAAITIRDEGAPRVRFETDRGAFVVQTIPSAAPLHVARFVERVRAGGYDGTIFHRIVPAFVVQGGDPRGDGSGSGGDTIRQEFSPVPYERGVLGMPRSDHPDSGGCQLFFCHGSTPHLDQRYTVFGRIVEGIDVIDRIDLGDRILSAKVVQ